MFFATRTRLFLKISFDVAFAAWLVDCLVEPVFAMISVEPPVDGLARSIISLGIGIVLFKRLTAAGTLWC